MEKEFDKYGIQSNAYTTKNSTCYFVYGTKNALEKGVELISDMLFNSTFDEEELKKELDVLKTEHQGSLLLITARGTRREIMEKIQAKNPLFCEVLPLTLEEIFISETEVAGYEVKNLFQ